MGRRTGKEASSGSGINGVAKSDVDLHWNPCSGQLGEELDAHAVVLVILFDSCAFDRLAVEHNAVFVLNLADRPNCLFNFCRWQRMIRVRVDPGPLWAGECGLSTA